MHTLQIYFRPDNYPDWVPWKSFSGKFTAIGVPGSLGAGGNPTIRALFSPRLSFGKPPDRCDGQTTKRNLRRGYNFQVKLNGSGHVVIDRLRLHAQREVESSRAQPVP